MMQPPQRNLGAGEAWGRWVENVLKNFDLDKVTSNASRAITQSVTALNYTSEITNNVADVFTLSENAIATANDAVTWSLLDPVNPPGTEESPANIPTNNSATWFTIEADGTVLRMWQWSPLDDSGQWVQQKFGTDTISPESISAELLAQSVSDDIETAKSGAAAAQSAANEANTAATNAQSAANAANQAALDAAGVAAGKGKIVYAASAPTGDDRNANNLWINTADGANTPMRWDGTNWVAVSDKKAVDAANAAANAQSKADQAFTNAQNASDAAAAANLAANHAQTTADGKNTVYYQTAEPAGADLNLKVNDVWYDTDDGYKMYRYSGAAWVAAALGSSALSDSAVTAAKLAANAVTADKILDGAVGTSELSSAVNTTISTAQSTAEAAQSTANTAKTNAQTAQTAADNAASAAASAAGIANSKGKVLIQSTTPVAADQLAQNLWIDTTSGANTPKRWSGSAWVAVTDKAATDAAAAAANAASAASTAQTTADAAQTAATAAGNAASAAQSAANAAQTTANGKNKITRSTSAASGSGVAGDQWWQYSGTQIIAMWIHNGSSWVAQTLTDSVITNLNAGTITAGTLNADRIGAASITGGKIAGATITASNMVAGTITAASGIIANAAIGDAQIINGSITNASIKDATIQSAKIAALDAGKITTGYLGADRIAANSITAAKLVTGTITADSGVIADLAITNAMIADGSIQNAKIANLDAGKINTGTINAARIAANSITADKLNANAFTGQTFTGGVFTAGGGALPKVLVGPASGIPGTGDQYGVYISTPNSNTNGSAALSVSPIGPSLTFQDGSANETFYVDGNGNIRIKNLTDGGTVDLTKLTTQRWTWKLSGNLSVIFNNANGVINGIWAFFESAQNGQRIPSVLQVSSPTGRLRIDSGVRINQSGGTSGNAAIVVQWGLYTSNPDSNDRLAVTTNLLGNLGRAECYYNNTATPFFSGGSDIVDVTPNQTYWVRPFYRQGVIGPSETRALTNMWVSVTPA